MQAGITSQYGFLYQRYVFIKILLDNIGEGKFFTYEGKDDIEISEKESIVSISISCNTFCQVKSGTVTRDCWAKIIGNWLLIDNEKSVYKVILENKLTFDYHSKEIVSEVSKYFFEGKNKNSNSIANKVYKKFIIDYKNTEKDFQEKILMIVSKITYEVFSLETLKENIVEKFKSVYCSDIKTFELAKNCRCNRFFDYIHNEINEAIEKKKSYNLKYQKFISIINKVVGDISDTKYRVEISEIKKKKRPVAESLMNKNECREIKQLRLVNSDSGFIIGELVKELLYKDLREVYFENNNTLISNIEETAHSNFEDVVHKLSNCSKPKQVFDETVEKDIPLSIVDNSSIYRYGCYTYLTSDEVDKDKQITWGQENE